MAKSKHEALFRVSSYNFYNPSHVNNCIKEIDFFFKIGIVGAYVVEPLHFVHVLLVPGIA